MATGLTCGCEADGRRVGLRQRDAAERVTVPSGDAPGGGTREARQAALSVVELAISIAAAVIMLLLAAMAGSRVWTRAGAPLGRQEAVVLSSPSVAANRP